MALHALVLAGQPTAVAFTPRGPIFIQGDAGFTAANGVIGGSGTTEDPFVIAGWEINASTADGIVIRNTTSPFVVGNAFVHSGGSTHVGIRLENAADGRIENTTVAGNKEGVVVDSCDLVELVGNRIWDQVSGPGISAFQTTGLRIRANNISSNAHYGIYAHSAVDLDVRDNEIHDNAFDGIDVASGSNVTVANNTVSGSGAFGINVGSTTGVTVTGNRAWWNTEYGIYLLSSPDALVTDNIVVGNDPVSIRIQTSDGVSLLRNNISMSPTGISISASARGDIRNNTVKENNWGLILQSVTNTTVTGNIFLNNTAYGPYLVSSTDNRIHHNWFTNSQANDDPVGLNAWDDGYPSGGNWWIPYGGLDHCHGPAQDNCTASDGVGDSARYIYGLAEDRYPLVPYVPWSPPVPNRAPVATFTISPPSGPVGTTFVLDPSSSRDQEDNSYSAVGRIGLFAGTPDWEKQTERGEIGRSSPAVTASYVYVSAGGYLEAFDYSTGTPDTDWGYQLDGQPDPGQGSSPAVVQGYLFIGSHSSTSAPAPSKFLYAFKDP